MEPTDANDLADSIGAARARFEQFLLVDRRGPATLAGDDPPPCTTKNYNGIPPVHRPGDADCFFQMFAITPVTSGNFAVWSDRGMVYTDVVSGNFYVVNGSIAAGAAAAKREEEGSAGEQDAQEKTSLQQFITNGGNAAFKLAYPLASRWLNGRYAMAVFTPRVGLELPALGGAAASTQANYDVGTDLQVNLPTNDKAMALFANVRVAYARPTDAVEEALGTLTSQFGYAHATVGLRISSNYVISWTRTVAGPRALRALGGQIAVNAVRSRSTEDTPPK